jgi:hypothetical protein
MTTTSAQERPRLLDREFAGMMTAAGADGCDPVQRQDMRRAFFAGAAAFNHLIMANADAGDEPTDNDMALMEALQAELDAFGGDLRNGRA